MNKFIAVLMIAIGVFVIARSHQLAERQFLTATTKLESWLFRPFRNYAYLFWILGGIGFILIGGGYLAGILK